MKEQFKSIQILHYALVGGCIMVGVLLIFMGPSKSDLGGNMLPLAIGLIAFSCFYFSTFIYNSRLKEANSLGDVEEKLFHYRSNSVVRWALLEGPALAAILMYFMTGNNLLIVVYGIAVAMLFLARPTVEGFIKDYKLNSQEASEARAATRNV